MTMTTKPFYLLLKLHFVLSLGLKICDKYKQKEISFSACRSVSTAQVEHPENNWQGTNSVWKMQDQVEPESHTLSCRKHKHPPAKTVSILRGLLHNRVSNPGHWREILSNGPSTFVPSNKGLCSGTGNIGPHGKHTAHTKHPGISWKDCSVAVGSRMGIGETKLESQLSSQNSKEVRHGKRVQKGKVWIFVGAQIGARWLQNCTGSADKVRVCIKGRWERKEKMLCWREPLKVYSF